MNEIVYPEQAAVYLSDPDSIPERHRPFIDRLQVALGNVDQSTALYRLAYNVHVPDDAPMAGHAVRLTHDYGVNAPADSIGLLLGIVGRSPDHLCIAFGFGRAFRGPQYNEDPHNFSRWIVVSNGGPITDRTPTNELTPTQERTTIDFWMWSHTPSREWTYSLSVPVWSWTPPSRI